MNYTKWVLGEETAEELLNTIKSRIAKDDPQHLVYEIVDTEITKVIQTAPITIEKLERVLTGDLNPGNGIQIDACMKKLKDIGYAATDCLIQKNKAILSTVKSTYFGGVYLEMRSAARQHMKANDTSRSL